MPRETIKNDVPLEWRRRYKAGLCPVCEKSPEEFDKGQRIFCSSKCRGEYSSKFISWSELREKALKLYGNKCTKCGITEEKHRRTKDKEKLEFYRNYVLEHKQDITNRRDELLVDLDKRYRGDFERINNDQYVAEKLLDWEERRKYDYYNSPTFEVDHKLAIVNGGDMWDINNLQVLCKDCHNKKTQKDLKTRTINKVRSKHKPLDVKDG